MAEESRSATSTGAVFWIRQRAREEESGMSSSPITGIAPEFVCANAQTNSKPMTMPAIRFKDYLICLRASFTTVSTGALGCSCKICNTTF